MIIAITNGYSNHHKDATKLLSAPHLKIHRPYYDENCNQTLGVIESRIKECSSGEFTFKGGMF